MTTVDKIEIMKTYPHCWAAALYVEEIVATNPPDDPDPETAWGYLTKTDMTPPEVAAAIRSEFEPLTGSARAVEFSELAHRQMNHPTFLVYIAGKMGAV